MAPRLCLLTLPDGRSSPSMSITTTSITIQCPKARNRLKPRQHGGYRSCVQPYPSAVPQHTHGAAAWALSMETASARRPKGESSFAFIIHNKQAEVNVSKYLLYLLCSSRCSSSSSKRVCRSGEDVNSESTETATLQLPTDSADRSQNVWQWIMESDRQAKHRPHR